MIADEGDLNIDQLRDIVQDANLNFMLGAGASSPMFRLLGDLENILTSIDSANSGDKEKSRARASAYASFFDSVILRNRELFEPSQQALQLRTSYASFLQSINRVLLQRRSPIISKQVNLFTTNIDLAIEAAAEDLQIELNDGFSGRFAPRFSTSNFGSVLSRRSLQYDNLSEIPTFNLLKLHGSVGWRTRADASANGRIEIAFDASLDAIRIVESELAEIRDSLLTVDATTTADELLSADPPTNGPSDLATFIAAYEQLAIVNPTKAKFQLTVLNQNYYDLLRIFSNEMEKENSVLFVIGFSCRDEHIRELMVRAARANPTLQIIIFAYSDTSLPAISSEFDGYPITNGNIRVVGPPPSTGEPVLRYDLRTITTEFFASLLPNSKTHESESTGSMDTPAGQTGETHD